MTFEELSNRYAAISIPVIQRDYVQGRAVSDRQKEDRLEFIHNLLDATLPGAASCHLDFIYGSCDESGDFLPLDGQQRLTTIFLLHCVLLKKSGLGNENRDEYDRCRTLLRKFTYKTRLSSQKFCEKLLEKELIPERDCDSLSKMIRYQGWFSSTMKYDPTVQAMLQMIEALEDALNEDKYSGHTDEMCRNLFGGDCITFSLLDLDEYKLTDALYVKMNARGKELTPFENWKADFTEFLTNTAKEYKDVFKDKIEHDWHDLFWPEVYGRCNLEQEYPRIDEHFMCYFVNMHRLLYFLEKGKDAKADSFKPGVKSQQDEVFSRGDGNGRHPYVNFLFSSLDWLFEVDKHHGGLDYFFSSLLQNESDITKWQDKVFLFGEGNGELNLFRRFSDTITFEGFHVLFYAILLYGTSKRSYAVDLDFKDFVRQCRNHLESKRYFDRSALLMQAQVRANSMAEYDEEFNKYLSLIQHPSSIRKRLEDLSYTLGDASAFTALIADVESGKLAEKDVIDAVAAFDKADTIDRIKVLLSYGFTGIKLGGWCSYGERVFFGSKTSRNIHDKVNHWDVVFSTGKDPGRQSLANAIDLYVRDFIKTRNLKNLISIVQRPRSVPDYLLKYPDMLAAQVPWRSSNPNDAYFFFAMKSPMNNLDMIAIHSYSGNPLAAAYQVCPVANAVVHKLSFLGAKYLGYVGHAADKEGIYFKDNADEYLFRIVFRSQDWEITHGFDIIPEPIKLKYSIGDDNILRDNESKDLVEIATEFLEDIQPLLMNTGRLHA